MKLALFKYTHDSSYVCVKTEEEASVTTAARVSHWVDVEFPPRSPDEYLPEQIEAVNRRIEQKRAEHVLEIAKLEKERREMVRSELAELGVC
jgi:hypothetical protein